MSKTADLTNYSLTSNSADLSAEIAELDRAIVRQGITLDNLKARRYELLIHQEDFEMQDVIDCIIENGLTAQEAIKAIVQYVHP